MKQTFKLHLLILISFFFFDKFWVLVLVGLISDLLQFDIKSKKWEQQYLDLFW